MKVILKRIKSIEAFFLKHIIVIVGSIVSLPFILISYFNNPSHDDYCYVTFARDFGYWQSQINWYLKWSSRYTASAILSLKVIDTKGLFWYKVFPIFLMVTFFVAIFKLVQAISSQFSFRNTLNITFLIFILYIAQLPIISESFYWWAGAITYQLGSTLTIVLLICIIKLYRKKSNLYTLISSLLAFLAIGCNEITMVIIVMTLFLYLTINYKFNKKINYQLLFVFIIAVISAVIVYFAPGNFIRQEGYPQKHQLIRSLILASGQLFFSVLSWCGLIFLFSLLIYKELKNNISSIILKNKAHVLPYLMGLFLISLLSFFTSLWATGEILPPRSRNAIYLFMILGIIPLYLLIINRYSNTIAILFSNTFFYGLLSISILSIAFGKSNIQEVYKDLVRGKAYKYDLEIKERNKVLAQANEETDLKLHPIQSKPKTIFIKEIENGGSSCFAYYWKIKSVTLENK